MALLNVEQLSVHFGDEETPFRAVDRISYQVEKGQVVGIVGESGSGKSVRELWVSLVPVNRLVLLRLWG